jgi:diguanylate cyclase (GGDEF)-like protein
MRLCPNDAARGRLVDMSRRLTPAKRGASLAAAVAVVIGMPTFGVWYAVPLVLVAAVAWFGQTLLAHFRRPEYVLAASWGFAQLMIAVSIALAHGPRLYLLALFILPLLLWSLAFPAGAAAVGIGLTAVLMVATAFIADPHAVTAEPFSLIFPLAWMIATSIPSAAVRDLDSQSRRTAVVDQLTGLLNRVALEARVAELSHQTTVTGHRVAVILGDVDHFKQINDTHGHAVGDRVLADVAGRLSEILGAEIVFRLGGEEFLVLLVDVDDAGARSVAERLRAGVRRAPVHDLDVTMSFGVAVSPADAALDYERLFARADAALYRAKHDGRDRVVTATPVEAASSAAREADRRRHDDGPTLSLVGAAPAHTARAADRRARRRATSSWLVRDSVEREHLVDLGRRVHQRNLPAYAIAFATVAASAPRFGWAPIVAPLTAAVVYNVVEHVLDKLRRPEYALGAMWLVAQAANAIGLICMRVELPSPPLYPLPLMAIMIVSSCAVFPRRGAIIGVSFSVLMTIVAGVVVNPTLAAHDPVIIALTVSLIVSAGFIGLIAGRSAVDHRGAAVVDQLTGMLNRGALDARVAELSHHATAVGQEVAVIVADLDHFKQVNDSRGHRAGDEVLQTVAYRIRKQLRAFESAYRIGGEEFVVLLPGVSADAAERIADRIWSAVRDEPIGDLRITVSLGVAASDASDAFDFGRLFGAADAALYEAKREGRDRVRRSGSGMTALAA